MKDILKPTLVLLIICLIASCVLALIYKKTETIIKENNRIAEENARKDTLSIPAKFIPVDINGKTESQDGFNKKNVSFYIKQDSHGNFVGFTFQCIKYGYSSDIKTIVRINKDMKITGIKVVSQQETPGLGAKCVTPKFAAKFKNKNPGTIKVKKDGGKIESITGATITTRAITNAIREKFLKLKDEFKKFNQGTK